MRRLQSLLVLLLITCLSGCSVTSMFLSRPHFSTDVFTYPYRSEQQGVSMGVDIIEPERFQTMFRGADVSKNGVQPLLITKVGMPPRSAGRIRGFA